MGVCVVRNHRLKGLLKKAPYVSPSGYAVMLCSFRTQGVALGCGMKPLWGNRRETDIPLFQQALKPVATRLCWRFGGRAG